MSMRDFLKKKEKEKTLKKSELLQTFDWTFMHL